MAEPTGETVAKLLGGPDLFNDVIKILIRTIEAPRTVAQEYDAADGRVDIECHRLPVGGIADFDFPGDDIERLCKRMLVIDHGRVIYDGDLDTVGARYGADSVLVVDFEETLPPIEVDGATVERVDGPRQWLRFRRENVTAAALLSAIASKAAVRDIAIQDPDIEDVVRRIYGSI